MGDGVNESLVTGDLELLSWDQSVPNAQQFYETLWEPNGKYDEFQMFCRSQNGTFLEPIKEPRTVPSDFIIYDDDQTWMIIGIVFIVLFVITLAVAIFLFWKLKANDTNYNAGQRSPKGYAQTTQEQDDEL